MRSFALFLLLGCAASQALPSEARSIAVKPPTEGWSKASPEEVGIDSSVLADALEFIHERKLPIHSLLLVRDGRLILEAYFFPYDGQAPHDLASVTKSVTSTLIGIALGDDAARVPLASIFPEIESDGRKARITLGHLLTMTSGLECQASPSEITLEAMRRSSDWVRYMLDLPMVAEPGQRFVYCSGGMHLLSGVLSKVTGTSALEFARSRLFEPLGIRASIWPADPQGISHGWGDLHLHPRDMAKIGELWLDGGRWGDRQIIPPRFLQAAVMPHVRAPWGDSYGYGIWVHPDREPPVFEGIGRGSQRISVVPAARLVAVITGGAFEPGQLAPYIARAIKSDRAIAANPAGLARLDAAVAAAIGAPPEHDRGTLTAVSGKRFLLDANPLGLRSFAFDDQHLRLTFEDGGVEEHAVGLAGVPLVSGGGRYGLPVAIVALWSAPGTLVLDYDEVANINRFHFTLRFSGNAVAVDVAEESGLIKTSFNGRLEP